MPKKKEGDGPQRIKNNDPPWTCFKAVFFPNCILMLSISLIRDTQTLFNPREK